MHSYIGHGDAQNKHGVGVCKWPEPARERQSRIVPSAAETAVSNQPSDGEVRMSEMRI